MSYALEVLNGPTFNFGDEIVVKYTSTEDIQAEFIGSFTINSTRTFSKGTLSFVPSYDQPVGIEGYDFVQDSENFAIWRGNVLK